VPWSHRAPRSLAERPRCRAAARAGSLFPHGAGLYGRKESKKPRIAELKKAHEGTERRTLAHRRATSPRSR